jgi:hypothetical protein
MRTAAGVVLLASEATGDRAGRDTVVSGLLDLLLVYMVRAWLQENSQTGWPRALHDRPIAAARNPGTAIHRIHRSTAHGIPDLVADDHRGSASPRHRLAAPQDRATSRLRLTVRVLPCLQASLRHHSGPLPLQKAIRNRPAAWDNEARDGRTRRSEDHAETGATYGLHIERHRDGSVRGRGRLVDGRPDGYWEWFRLDGTKMRSGHFDRGREVGEWTAYDRTGAVYKVTTKR